MGRSSNTTALTVGAISAAIYLVILLGVVYVPFLNFVFFLFLPIPFIVLTFKIGIKFTALVSLVTLFLTPIVAPLPSMLLTLLAASVGLVMGYFYLQRKGPFLPILMGVITYVFNYLLIFVVSFFIFNMNIIDVLQQSMADMLNMTEGTADFLNLPLDQQQLDLFKQNIEVLTYIFPALITLSSMVMVFGHHLVNRPILARLGFQIEQLPALRDWSIPKSILYYYVISIILLLIGLPEGSTIFMIIVNLQPILEVLLYIQGLAVITYLGYNKSLGKMVPIMVVILSFLFPILQFIVRFLGILEMGFGVRQRIK